jgi:hypothetical protein
MHLNQISTEATSKTFLPRQFLPQSKLRFGELSSNKSLLPLPQIGLSAGPPEGGPMCCSLTRLHFTLFGQTAGETPGGSLGIMHRSLIATALAGDHVR